MTLGDGLSVLQRDQHVRRFDVAVDDPFLVGVLDGLADRHEQLKPLARSQMVLVAEVGNRDTADQFHHKIRPAGVGCPRIEHGAILGWSISARA